MRREGEREERLWEDAGQRCVRAGGPGSSARLNRDTWLNPVGAFGAPAFFRENEHLARPVREGIERVEGLARTAPEMSAVTASRAERDCSRGGLLVVYCVPGGEPRILRESHHDHDPL